MELHIMAKKTSYIIELYKSFFQHAWSVGSWTPVKGSRVVTDFWFLFIGAGFYFAETDLIELKKWCEADIWRPLFHCPGEGHYSLAVHERNISFCRAYEKLVGRKAFIGKQIDYEDLPNRYTCCQTQKRTQGRLVINASFNWKSEKVTVTSFKDDDHSLVACAYYPRKDGYKPNKIRKRFTITHKEYQKSQKRIVSESPMNSVA